MKTAIAIFMTVHGIIHLLGFLKAFNFIKLKGLNMPISKPAGIVWLLSFVLFAATVNLFISGNGYYVGVGFTGVLFSQVVIIQSWKEAKYGTVPNIIFALLLLVSF